MAVQVTVVVADKASRAQGARPLTFNATATGVSAGNVLRTIFPSTDGNILRLLDTVRFSTLSFAWNGSFSGISGSPNVSAIPGLSSILSVLQFSPQDVQMKLVGPGTVTIAISKTFTLNLNSPFVGPSSLMFGLSFSPQGTGMIITAAAQFAASLRMSFLDPTDVSFTLGAALIYNSGAPPPGLTFRISASVTSDLAFKGVTFIKINYIGGSIGLMPVGGSVNIASMDFAAKGLFLDTQIAVDMYYDFNQRDFGIMFAMQSFDMEVRCRGGRCGGCHPTGLRPVICTRAYPSSAYIYTLIVLLMRGGRCINEQPPPPQTDTYVEGWIS
jgi:hypothetical protein